MKRPMLAFALIALGVLLAPVAAVQAGSVVGYNTPKVKVAKDDPNCLDFFIIIWEPCEYIDEVGNPSADPEDMALLNADGAAFYVHAEPTTTSGHSDGQCWVRWTWRYCFNMEDLPKGTTVTMNFSWTNSQGQQMNKSVTWTKPK